jgi:two-component system, chemotaxis family, protein-glutamate methylesterase/glutaminase
MAHDIIAIGASAGGVEVLLDLVQQLPADLPASVFIVVHVTPNQPSVLPELLTHRGPLPAKHPLHDEKIVAGHIYVAPPDNHLMIRQGSMAVVRGPKENGHRPAADVLFRTAAAAYGPRVIGVVLSGYQTCGTAGMLSIKARGGVSVVQSPATARAQDMPRSVIDQVAVDHIVDPAELPQLLARLVAMPAGPELQPDTFIKQLEGNEPGAAVELACPLCDGVLTEAQRDAYHHFRCHVGHAFSLDSLVREQSEAVERALWAAIRALEESAALSARLSTRETGDRRERVTEKANSQRTNAELIRQIVLHGKLLTRADGSKL